MRPKRTHSASEIASCSKLREAEVDVDVGSSMTGKDDEVFLCEPLHPVDARLEPERRQTPKQVIDATDRRNNRHIDVSSEARDPTGDDRDSTDDCSHDSR